MTRAVTLLLLVDRSAWGQRRIRLDPCIQHAASDPRRIRLGWRLDVPYGDSDRDRPGDRVTLSATQVGDGDVIEHDTTVNAYRLGRESGEPGTRVEVRCAATRRDEATVKIVDAPQTAAQWRDDYDRVELPRDRRNLSTSRSSSAIRFASSALLWMFARCRRRCVTKNRAHIAARSFHDNAMSGRRLPRRLHKSDEVC